MRPRQQVSPIENNRMLTEAEKEMVRQDLLQTLAILKKLREQEACSKLERSCSI